MPSLTKKWLELFDWDFVTETNKGLCRQKNALHKPTSDGHEPTRKLWEESRTREIKLTEALDLCRQCHRLAPFCFYNGNTFAAIARELVAELSGQLPADRLHILRSLAGHIVAGTATVVELKQFDRLIQELDS